MMRRRAPRVRKGTTATAVALVLLSPCLATGVVQTHEARADELAACDAWDVEYLLSARVKISDTTMGLGNGTYATGPGRLVLRLERRKAAADETAKLIDYRMRDHFTVRASMLVASASVTAETVTVTTPDACGVSALGTLSGRTLRWAGPWTGMHSDGTLDCVGSLCGTFGAPPAGASAVRVEPHAVSFEPFQFSEDAQTFTMAYSVASSQRSPAQTSRIALAGREVKRSCVTAPSCGPRP